MVVVVVGFAVLIAKTAPWILKAPVGLVLMASLYSQVEPWCRLLFNPAHVAAED